MPLSNTISLLISIHLFFVDCGCPVLDIYVTASLRLFIFEWISLSPIFRLWSSPIKVRSHRSCFFFFFCLLTVSNDKGEFVSFLLLLLNSLLFLSVKVRSRRSIFLLSVKVRLFAYFVLVIVSKSINKALMSRSFLSLVVSDKGAVVSLFFSLTSVIIFLV